MVDLPLPGYGVRPRWPVDWTRAGVILTKRRWLLLFTMLLVLGWSGVIVEAAAEYAQKKCDSPLGKLAVRLKMDSHFSNCRCMKPALDFSDPCNSMYLGRL
jgi:hypothetical protein